MKTEIKNLPGELLLLLVLATLWGSDHAGCGINALWNSGPHPYLPCN